MLNDIPINSPERDRAWANFIRRKTVKAFMQDKSEFKFPLDGSYEIWCSAWEKAWQAGFEAGYKASRI